MKVFYCSEMVADSNSFSPSAAKPQHFVNALQASDLAIDLVRPMAVGIDQIALAHDLQYARSVLECAIPNGFGNCAEDVARSLPFTSGAMLSAAEAAFRERVTCAPVSGFHHARYARGGGFCTFNGLMIAALALRAKQTGIRVAIVDADQHYGDGTDDIIRKLGIRDIFHYSFGQFFHTPHHASAYLQTAGEIVAKLKEFNADVVLYQAGADVHVSDPLGGVLTSAQIAERDELIIAGCAAAGIPIAWNLAGGYQRDENGGISKVIDIHLATARIAHRVLGKR